MVSNDACDTSGAEFKPHISKIAFPQPKVFQEKIVAQTTECPNMTKILILTLTNCELKIMRFEMFLRSFEINNLTSQLAKLLCSEICLYISARPQLYFQNKMLSKHFYSYTFSFIRGLKANRYSILAVSTHATLIFKMWLKGRV